MDRIWTVGHGTLAADELAALLQEAEIDVVVDVRRYPGSRRHPHVNREELARWLPEEGIAYEWVAELGGRRRPDGGSRPHVPTAAARRLGDAVRYDLDERDRAAGGT